MHWDMGWMWVFWLIVIGLIVWLVTQVSQRGPSDTQRESPEQVLKRRYAQGEIDREAYEQMLADLRK